MIAPLTTRTHRTLRGFSELHHYWDATASSWIVQILPGEYYVSDQNEIITTILGSCISTCIRARNVPLAGMNHFMLPNEPGQDMKGAALRYGSYAVERLINELVKHGANRSTLEVKVFGGGRVIKSQTDIGASNIRFVREYFQEEGIEIKSEDVGGACARRVRYHCATGRVQIKQLPVGEASDVIQSEQSFQSRLVRERVSGEVELF